MALLRKAHQSELTVEHHFNLRERINFYEKLCQHHELLLFEDYTEVRGWMNHLLDRVERLNRPSFLSHIDSVADNFLFLPDGTVRLIDWEYSAMHDPLIDISMCGIYSYYDAEELDRSLEVYLERIPTPEERIATYAYAALGGFCGVCGPYSKVRKEKNSGEYTIIMYHYAKHYYKRIARLFPD